jgi:hypothetical protein
MQKILLIVVSLAALVGGGYYLYAQNNAPVPSPSTGPLTLSGSINQTLTGGEVTIVPLEILEDSRCPVDVQCIQAGTVRIKARVVSGLGESEMTFTLNKEITTEAESVTLTDVQPVKKSTVHPSPSEYTFTFTVTKR